MKQTGRIAGNGGETMRKSIVCAGCALLLALLSRYAADCADAVRAAL